MPLDRTQWRVCRPATTQQAVTDALREMILMGRLAPGERIDQQLTAELLGVSRMPVREGLRVLSAEGLVTIYPHQGAVVSELSPEEIEDVFSVRSALEGMAARLAVLRLTEEAIEHLAQCHRSMGQAADHDEWLELNESFHSTLYALSGRSRLLGLIDSLRNTVRPYIRLYISLDEHKGAAQAQHGAILEACRACDAQMVAQLVEEHLDTTCRRLLVRHRTRATSPQGEPSEDDGALAPAGQ